MGIKANQLVQTFYTFGRLGEHTPGERWPKDRLYHDFFRSYSDARKAVYELREEIVSDMTGSGKWMPMQIERVELAPLDIDNTLALLNSGPAAVVLSIEALEVVF